MDKNILYQNLDMLSVMESCEDNSVDFILVFMPSNMGGTIGYTSLRPVADKSKKEETYNRKLVDCASKSIENQKVDFGELYFFDKVTFNAYIDLIKKVAQNAKRVLKADGVLLIAMPVNFGYSQGSEDEREDFPLLFKQVFTSVIVSEISNYSINASTEFSYNNSFNKYNLYFCTNRMISLQERNTLNCIRLSNYDDLLPCIYNSRDIADRVKNGIDSTLKSGFDAVSWTSLRSIFIPELMNQPLRASAAHYPVCGRDRVGLTHSQLLERLNTEKAFARRHPDEPRNEVQMRVLELASNPDNLTPLAESLMLAFCKEGDKALFPYDRNGQYAYVADKLCLRWMALYKRSYDEKGNLGTNYLKKIHPNHYAVSERLPYHRPMKYRSNLVSSIADANLITAQLTKYTDLMSQVIQCASDNGWDNTGDMEDAVHALISLAVKSHAGSIVGDEAEKWFGEGWKLLSAQCKNYLQTAAAYDKISQQNGNADCAPIGIEFYRALEHELNRTPVNDLFAYIKENNERVKEILENTEQSNDMKRIASTMSAILNDETVRGLTLGEIYQSLKAAAVSSDKDVGGVIAKCCRERGYANLLSHDNVGCLGMAAQLRNLCAHPSDIDGSFMGLNLQIVRRTLKEQQVQAESQCDNNMSSVCAIIGPDNNKMKYPEDTTNMKAAIKSLILMFYKSGIRQYASTGNSGFDLLVGEALKECRQSGEAKSIKVVEYLPCERDKMKFAPNRKKRVLAIDKFATIEVCGDADNATNRGVCQEKALENAAFCIAFYAEDGQSAIANRVKDAMQRGTIVYNTYGII